MVGGLLSFLLVAIRAACSLHHAPASLALRCPPPTPTSAVSKPPSTPPSHQFSFFSSLPPLPASSSTACCAAAAASSSAAARSFRATLSSRSSRHAARGQLVSARTADAQRTAPRSARQCSSALSVLLRPSKSSSFSLPSSSAVVSNFPAEEGCAPKPKRPFFLFWDLSSSAEMRVCSAMMELDTRSRWYGSSSGPSGVFSGSRGGSSSRSGFAAVMGGGLVEGAAATGFGFLGMITAGMPQARAPSGSALVTTLFAPTLQLSPTRMAPSTLAPHPIMQLAPTIGCRRWPLGTGLPDAPSVTWW
mmetsp:Transcript_25054/g.56850  ORF Transcript_25054/g.56850 Transcript_25054/m.56850 type:complete len:304 (+) Transcript_25054:223-1134(+)